MKLSDNKLKHSLAVAEKMEKVAKTLFPNDIKFQKDMFLLGYVHDIGYQYSNKPEDHPKVGYDILNNSNYEYSKEVLYHGKRQEDYQSIALDILNYADYTTDHNGNYVDVETRVRNIGKRYGLTSHQYMNALKFIPDIHTFEEKINKSLSKKENKKVVMKRKMHRTYRKSKNCYDNMYNDISKKEISEIIDTNFFEMQMYNK